MTSKTSLFIDESGKPDLDKPTYRHFLLTSIIVPETELSTISGYFSYIKRKYTLPINKPFHTYELLEKPNTKLEPEKAKDFVMSMCEFIETCPIEIFLIHTDKGKFQKKYKELSLEKKGIVYFLSAYKQFQLFTDYLKRQNALGNIYADSRYNQDRDILDAYLKLMDRELKGGFTNPYGEKSQKLLTTLTFANKFSLTPGLELADFISFTAFAKIQSKINQFKDIKLTKGWNTIKNKLVKGKIYSINPKLIKQFSWQHGSLQEK